LFGRRAARPLTRLQHAAAAIGSDAPSALAVADRYGTPEVDDVAAALNASLADLGDAIERREEALAAARNFAASATHELRTPLQSAMTNLDVAMAGPESGPGSGGGESVGRARGELSRMATSLATVQALSQADLAQPEWFEPMDVGALGDVADEVISRASTGTDSTIDLEVEPTPSPPVTHPVWPDGVRLALDNALRNALTHGRPGNGAPGRITVHVVASSPPSVIVDDNGPGISPDDAVRLLAPFERGPTATPGSGLGLAVADRVARAHDGRVEILPSPLGGTRVRITLGPERQP
jgi:two-component system sensor histidine kinase PrrB